jgi:hypothetical protein
LEADLVTAPPGSFLATRRGLLTLLLCAPLEQEIHQP